MTLRVFIFLTSLVMLLVGVTAAAARVAELTDPLGRTALSFHNEDGEPTETRDPRGKSSFLRHDWHGAVYESENALAHIAANTYDKDGTQRRFAWDAAGQMRGVSEISSAGQPIHYSVHTHDAAGRWTGETVFPSLHPFTAPAFAATYDDDNRLATFNGQPVTHDDDGNLTAGAGILPAAYSYDSRNRLTAAGGLAYTYDPAGNRIGVTDSSGETQWTIDPTGTLTRALVRRKPGGEKSWYIHGLGLLYEISETDTTATYHYDSKGSTIALSAGNGATVLDRIEYDPYGRETWRQANHDTPFRYHGAYGVQTDDNGLVHMRARYYHPGLRRFLNADPIGFAGGSNWYQFAAGNPIAFADPLGLEPVMGVAGGVAAVNIHGRHTGNAGAAGAAGEAAKLGIITEIAFGFSPLGPLMDAMDFKESYSQGSWGGMALAGVGFIPGGDLLKLRKFGDVANSVKPGQTMTSYPQGRVVGGRGESARLSDPPAGMRESGAWDPTPDNLALMERGRPPVGRDGLPVELHHRNQSPAGPLDQMTSTTHDTIPHPLSPSQINRSQFGGERARYWRGEARTLNGQ